MAGIRRQVAGTSGWEGAESGSLPGEAVPEGGAEHLARLERTIEAEIIPRLMLVHSAAPTRVAAEAGPAWVPQPEVVREFARLVLAHEGDVALAFVDEVRAQGASLESVCLGLLAPAARYLGELWAQDRCDFTEVTIGLCRLQQVLRVLAPVFQGEAGHRGPGRRILMAPAPGEQHTFGLAMVAEFLRRAGWDVRGGPATAPDELAQIVRGEWFDVIGFSMSQESGMESLAACIRQLKRASRNRSVGVMVGGRVFVERPEMAALVGADASAVDARQAALQAQSLLFLLAMRR